jgi:hypothetical protein
MGPLFLSLAQKVARVLSSVLHGALPPRDRSLDLPQRPSSTLFPPPPALLRPKFLANETEKLFFSGYNESNIIPT